MPTRRRFLAALGSLSIAGCSTQVETTSDGSTKSPTADKTTPAQSPIVQPEEFDGSWPMPYYDHRRGNYSPESSGPTSPIRELWRFETSTSLSKIIFADETSLFVGGDDGYVREINATSGDLRWRRQVESPTGTPRYWNGMLFVPTAAGITAFDIATKREVWHVDDQHRVGILVAPHGVYYVSNRDPPILVSLRLNGGQERWRAEITEPWTTTLFADSDHVMVSTGTHERVPWMFSADSGEYLLKFRPEEGGSDMTDERFILDDHVISVDPMFGEVSAARVDEGNYTWVWQRSIDAVGGLAISGGQNHVYVGAHHGPEAGLYALELTTGKTKWQIREEIEVVGRPTVGTETLLVRTTDSLRCYNPVTGKELWRRSTQGIGSHFIVVDDLVFTARNGVIRAFRPKET